MNAYSLSRKLFDFAFEEKECGVYHIALFYWIVELNNRMGWKKEFGLPTHDSCEGLSIGNKHTYLNALRDLDKWGFIKIVKESKNQFSATIISICCGESDTAQYTAQYTALDTALTRQGTQHGQSTVHAIDTIDKQRNKETIKQRNKETTEEQKDILVINNNPENPYNVDAYVKTLPDTDRQYVTDDFIYYASKFGHKWGYTERADDVRTWLKQLQSIHGHTADEMRSIIFQWYTYWIGQPEKKRPKDCKASLSKNPFMKNKYGK